MLHLSFLPNKYRRKGRKQLKWRDMFDQQSSGTHVLGSTINSVCPYNVREYSAKKAKGKLTPRPTDLK